MFINTKGKLSIVSSRVVSKNAPMPISARKLFKRKVSRHLSMCSKNKRFNFKTGGDYLNIDTKDKKEGCLMKKILMVVLSLIALSGCGSSVSGEEGGSSEEKIKKEVEAGKTKGVSVESKDGDSKQLNGEEKTGIEFHPFSTEMEYIEQEVKWNPEVKEQISQFIDTNHEFFNETLGWGKDKNVNWDQQKERADQIIEEVTVLLPKIEKQIQTMMEEKLLTDVAIDDDPRDLKHDFNMIQALLEIATKNQDVQGIIYAHRVFHDLDVEWNGYTSHKFGMSAYYHGGENRPVLYEYVEDNSSYIVEEGWIVKKPH